MKQYKANRIMPKWTGTNYTKTYCQKIFTKNDNCDTETKYHKELMTGNQSKGL
jgi:hypothetical protein